VSSYTTNASNELTATSGASYTYDSNGNTLTKTVGSNTTSYTWDFENRLTSVTLPGSGGTVSFKYDPLGRRIYKSSSGGTSVFAYDGDNLIEEANTSGTVVARYEQTQNIDEPLAMLRSGATSYYNADGLGTVTSLTNSSGAAAQTYTYDSFGKVTGSSGSLTNPFQYTGREVDPETGLYYYRARYYDPSTGRFLGEDHARYKGGINFYAYVRNNPIDFTDPLGRCPQPQPISCDTLLPNGQTIGDVVRRERAVLQNILDVSMQANQDDSSPLFALLGAFTSIAWKNGPIDFKNTMRGEADPVFLGQAGNFAYYAIGWGYFTPGVLDAGATTYAILTHHTLSSPDAQAVRNLALEAYGCQQ
jgi:RHS repeat-associated protein